MEVKLSKQKEKLKVGDGIVASSGNLWIISSGSKGFSAFEVKDSYYSSVAYDNLESLLFLGFPNYQRIIPSENLRIIEIQ